MTDDTTPEPDTEPDTENPNAEAAKYRHRLRATEVERDTLAGQVDALRRSAIDQQLTSKHRIAPAGFWAAGVQIEDLLDDDGEIDPERIAEAATNATTALGLQQTGQPYSPSEGRIAHPGDGGWQGAFAPR